MKKKNTCNLCREANMTFSSLMAKKFVSLNKLSKAFIYFKTYSYDSFFFKNCPHFRRKLTNNPFLKTHKNNFNTKNSPGVFETLSIFSFAFTLHLLS